MSTFSGTAFQLASVTVERSPRTSYAGFAQAFAGDLWETFFGERTPNSYASVNHAYRASHIVSKNWDEAPVGSFHYFASQYGQIGFQVGPGLIAVVASEVKPTDIEVGKGVVIRSIREVAEKSSYLGWSYTNGDRRAIGF